MKQRQMAFCCNAEAQAFVRALNRSDSQVSVDRTVPTLPQFAGVCIAVSLVASAYIGKPATVWPAQNVVNACVAISVARVLQIPNLAALLAALSLWFLRGYCFG